MNEVLSEKLRRRTRANYDCNQDRVVEMLTIVIVDKGNVGNWNNGHD